MNRPCKIENGYCEHLGKYVPASLCEACTRYPGGPNDGKEPKPAPPKPVKPKIPVELAAMRIQYCGQVCGGLHNATCPATPCKLRSGWQCPLNKWPDACLSL